MLFLLGRQTSGEHKQRKIQKREKRNVDIKLKTEIEKGEWKQPKVDKQHKKRKMR